MECKKIITGIISCLLAIFVMSDNVGAFDLTRDVVLLQGNYQSQINTLSPSNSCYQYLDSNAGVRNNCTDEATAISGIRFSIPERTYNPGDFLQVVLYTGINQENNSSDVFMRGLSLVEGSGVWDIVDVNMQSVNGSTGIVKITLRAYTNYTYNSNSHYLSFSSSSAIFVLYHNEYIYFGKTTAWGTIGGHDYSNQIQDVVDAIDSIQNIDYTQQFNSVNNNINNLNNSINDVEDAINNQHQEETDATQDAADDAQDSADDAQADSEAATSSLLSVITGFFGAMANLNPTNCKFDSHLPFLSGNGQIDLCQVPAPPVVQAIGSLILIGIMVPFAIHMYNRFISITGSFQK